MLEKVGNSSEMRLLQFRDIEPNELGNGVCMVRDGKTKISKMSKPFIVLYLQDINGMVIPGYIFNVEDFYATGIDLTKCIGSLVKVNYEENFIPNYGMSIRLTKVNLVVNPTATLVSQFVGKVDDVERKYDELMNTLARFIGIKYSLPFSLQLMSHMDYSQGKAGGVLEHYCLMSKVLCTYLNVFGEENAKQLFGTFLVFIHAHNNYLEADKQGAVDISFANKLTASIYKVMEKVNLAEGAAEVCNVFFGYEPKDIFVRTVCQVSKDILRVSKEKATWDTLPITREGNAGYGTIRRYKSVENR